MNYKADVKINKNDLDNEAMRLPTDWEQYASKETLYSTKIDRLSSEVEFLDDKLKTTRSEQNLKIRGMSVERINHTFGTSLDNRMTESVYKDLVEVSPEVKEAKKELFDKRKELVEARKHWARYRTARSAFDKKKDMLELLTRQHAQGWFIQELKSQPYRSRERAGARAAVGKTMEKKAQERRVRPK